MKKTNKIFSLILFAAWLLSCTKEPLILVDHSVIFPESKEHREWTAPTIKDVTIRFIKGQHFTAASIFSGTPCNHISVDVRFDSTIIYQTQDPDNQADLNKLFGMKSGADGRVNSCLIGFSYDPESGKARISPYPQQDKYRFWCFPPNQTPAFYIGEKIHIELTNYEDSFYVIIGPFQYEILKADYGISDYQNAKLVCPTWGGQEPAQNNTIVYL